MLRARSAFALLALSAGCGQDFQSLDDVMGELVQAVPTTLEIAAEHAQICPGSCIESASAHRLDLALVPVEPATRHSRAGDSIAVTGTFRLTRLEAEREELLAEGSLTTGQLVRLIGEGSAAFVLVLLSFDIGTLRLSTHDGEHWDAPSLTLKR
jgi:hypothetical protein